MDGMSRDVACWCVVLGTLVGVLVFSVMWLDLCWRSEYLCDHLCMTARVCIYITGEYGVCYVGNVSNAVCYVWV